MDIGGEVQKNKKMKSDKSDCYNAIKIREIQTFINSYFFRIFRIGSLYMDFLEDINFVPAIGFMSVSFNFWIFILGLSIIINLKH